MSNAFAGVGTKFRRWNGTNWVDLAEINSIDTKKSRATIKVTSLDSIGGYEEFIPGFRDGGTITLPMNFTRATYELMNDDYESDVIQNYEILLPDNEETSFEFEGFVTELGLGIPTDDKVSADASIKVTGKIVLNSGSGSSV
jgi:predicted secreted protein